MKLRFSRDFSLEFPHIVPVAVMTSLEDSSILYRNEQNTIFIIDIPTSIARAQELTPDPGNGTVGSSSLDLKPEKNVSRKHILSAPPLESPYAGSCEPKSEIARARLLDQVPRSERLFHDEIRPLLLSALQELRDEYRTARWCSPRTFSDEKTSRPRKRRAESGFAIVDEPEPAQTLLQESSPEVILRHRTASSVRPPTILSSTSTNAFESLSSLDGIVNNPSSHPAVLQAGCHGRVDPAPFEYIIPPESQFILCTIPISEAHPKSSFPISGLPSTRSFNLILFDPPWPNRSVRRSGHYNTHPYELPHSTAPGYSPHSRIQSGANTPNQFLPSLSTKPTSPRRNLDHKFREVPPTAYDSLTNTGFTITEEWIWIKTTANGDPVSPVDGLWRKPYEILVIGRREPVSVTSVTVSETVPPIASYKSHEPQPCVPKRRVIAAVPDLHSRKPNLKGLFEQIFFTQGGRVQRYSALEVFARNLTAGWCAAGNEVLKFNATECWVEE